MVPFDPISALIGGALVGAAATLLMWLNGRVAGISGILGDFLDVSRGERGWRTAFLFGLIAAPFAAAAVGFPVIRPDMPKSWIVVVAAGALVGVGTRIAGGCTSGHGICGLARLSPRSIVATGVFMVTAIIVVAVVRHGIGG